LKPDAKPEKWLYWLSQLHPEDVAIADDYAARVVDSPLTQNFWSQVPYAFGLGDGTIGRYGAIPPLPKPSHPTLQGNRPRTLLATADEVNEEAAAEDGLRGAALPTASMVPP
jgi:hypothetical protein